MRAGAKPVQGQEVQQGWAVDQFDIGLPEHLRAFGMSVQASLCGQAGAPLIVMLGGISANRFPCLAPGGAPGWWSGLAGSGRAIDPLRFQILGVDFAADDKGERAPSTLDQAEIVRAAISAVGADRCHAIVGSSYGGMIALSLGQHFPECVGRLVIVSAGAEPEPASTAAREIQRQIVALAIAAGRGNDGLAIARGLAMMTYRTRAEFQKRFKGGISGDHVLSPSEPGAYLRARGEAYRSVMSPERFLSLSASIDRHRVDPRHILHPTLLIGSTSDQLVPPEQMEALANQLAGPAELHLLHSHYGHDMFLKDADRLGAIIGPFLESNR